MLLAKIKGNKVHFGKLVTFFWGGWVYLPPTDPLDPLEGVLGGHLLEKFPRGGVSPNFKSQRGVRPPRTPLRTSMNILLFIDKNWSKNLNYLLSTIDLYALDWPLSYSLSSINRVIDEISFDEKFILYFLSEVTFSNIKDFFFELLNKFLNISFRK